MKYTKISAVNIRDIKNLIEDDSRIETNPEKFKAYTTDRLDAKLNQPDVIIWPLTTNEVSVIMFYANQHQIPVSIRGGGTGYNRGSNPTRNGILLDMTKMNQILTIDQNDLTLEVQAGVKIDEIENFLKHTDFFYAPEPGQGQSGATIGGNINTNASGTWSVKYGNTRDSVLSVTVVLPDGRVQEFGNRVARTSSGYDLKDLIIGSEGTLGVVTEAILKLLPKPRFIRSVVIPFKSMELAVNIVPKFFHEGLVPTNAEVWNNQIIKYWEKYKKAQFMEHDGAAALVMTFDGNNQSSVDREFNSAILAAQANGGLVPYPIQSNEDYLKIWETEREFFPAIKATTPELTLVDLVIPRSQNAEMLDFIHVIEFEEQVRLPTLVHAGDGAFIIYICRDGLDDDQWTEMKKTVITRLYQRTKELRGQISGQFGIGQNKAKYFTEFYGEHYVDFLHQIKQLFDPNDILNSNIIFD